MKVILGKLTQNNGHYTVRDHSMSPFMRLPISE